ncbi:50S ribosomal protein L25/general stress protein Ctc [Moraxella macacae 0408225]|uniref:Large ribosomal subunit protein bL25 n=1 Tax=Moraxella macacae 0408225 TaxID=1230338 RepID=L2F8U7_9GAMM|nr:50S ribosomal protein L25/general stress protein Ctc [Moraxella macacae]ELA09330.1 50S ribosomal protein L25/general stress protein Ctc [Moraxella macacae 0408225]
MSNQDFAKLSAVLRGVDAQGKGASRRLRKQNQVPAIIYGADKEPLAVALRYNELIKSLQTEAFFSHILTINVEGHGTEEVVIKDLQRHPAKNTPMHADFQRIVRGQEMHVTVPFHYEGADVAPGHKEGGIFTSNATEIEVTCIPSKIPEFIKVDVSSMQIGDSIHLQDVTMPEGVVIRELQAENAVNRTIATMQAPTVEVLEPIEPEEHKEAAGTRDPEGDEEARKLQAQDETHDAPKSDDE